MDKIRIGILVALPVLKVLANFGLFIFLFDGTEKIGDIQNQLLQSPCNISNLMPWNEFFELYQNCTFVTTEIRYTKEINAHYKNESDLTFHLKYVTADLRSFRNVMRLQMELQKEMREPCILSGAKNIILPSLKILYLYAWILVGISLALTFIMAILIYLHRTQVKEYLWYFVAFCWVFYALLCWSHVSTLKTVSEKMQFLVTFKIDDVLPKC